MMSPDRLWAKSKHDDEPDRPSMLLSGHLADVFEAATRVVDATGDDQLLALGLQPVRYHGRLQQCVLLAAAIHDLGKANDHFQGMVRGVRDVRQNPQGLRHEWVTVLILNSLKPWLIPAVGGSEVDFAIVEWAVAGHHPAYDHESPPKGPPKQGGSGPEILLLTGHHDFAATLARLASRFSLVGPTPEFGPAKRQLNTGDVFGYLGGWTRTARRLWDSLPPEDRRFVAAVKSCLIAADVAGSALPKVEPENAARWDWVTKSFANLPVPGDIQEIADHRLNGNAPRKFQEEVARSQAPVTYVKAGCGTGKTVAAYLWAAANHPTRRIYFCYPTTGTATEGFKDYLFEPDGQLGDIGAKLFHSRRDVDFEIILNTGADSQTPEADSTARLESLEAWSTPIVACTVDTVLGLVQNNKRGLFAWPALAQSAFVFDEIHAYDDRLFGALLRFLRDMPGLPCLLMTASLPEAREEALFQTVRMVHGFQLDPIPGPKELEQLPRYQKEASPDIDPLPIIEREIQAGGKVLWVCNTVRRVMGAAERAKCLDPLIYHSRFRYEDRVERHRDVVQAFTPECQEPALAICSQVAEMSLDLKGCTLLVTDLATVPALIQRLGRLNRQAKPGDRTRPFVVIEPDMHLPYTSAELSLARAWLARLPDTNISQQHLSDHWEQSDENPPEPVSSAWLDDGWKTTVKELRDASQGITVLMREDVPRVLTNPKLLSRFVLPMLTPRSKDWRGWKQYHSLPIAEPGTITYDKTRGAEWNA